MKRLACFLLILCLVPVCAFALDLSEFNDIASVFGADRIDEKTATVKNGAYYYNSDDCQIIIVEESGEFSQIFITGKGDAFLAYCAAAIYVSDSANSFVSNNGQLLTVYLMAHKGGRLNGQMTHGQYFFIEQKDDYFIFMTGK